MEHRGDVIRKLKETLRKTQRQDEQSCKQTCSLGWVLFLNCLLSDLLIVLFICTVVEGEEPHSKPYTQAKPSTCQKDQKIEELEKKTAQFER